MIYYEQLVEASPARMGRQKGWCLQDTRLSFGFKVGKFASARADAQAQIKNGTMHPIDTLPTNVSVPVYIKIPGSKYDHVILSHFGTFYSDGKKISRNFYKNYYGWGEFCDGQRVVKPTALKQFLPAKGYWQYGDQDERIDFLTTFLYATFPAYAKRNVLGNIYGKNTVKAIKEFQRRTGLYVDGILGKNTYAMLKKYGFKY